jgi:hypothetical protein
MDQISYESSSDESVPLRHIAALVQHFQTYILLDSLNKKDILFLM